jgi:hypothetical protein
MNTVYLNKKFQLAEKVLKKGGKSTLCITKLERWERVKINFMDVFLFLFFLFNPLYYLYVID